MQDGLTGLTYMQQRYYDPQVGRFLSVDPVTAYSAKNWRHFNRYAYAYENPYKFQDKDGRAPDDAYLQRVKAKQTFYDLKNGFEGVIDANFQNGKMQGYEIHVYEKGKEVGVFREGQFLNKHGHGGKLPEGMSDHSLGKLKGLDNHMAVATGRIKVSVQRAARLRFNARSMKAGARFLGPVGAGFTVYQVATGQMDVSEAIGIESVACSSITPCGGYVPKTEE